MKRKYFILLIPFIFLLASCGKKKDPEEFHSYIERLTNEDVTCYRIITVGFFGHSTSNWKCSSTKVYLP